MKYPISLLAIALMLVSALAKAGEFVKPAPLPIEQMRAVAYTKAFAKRFALPEPEPGTEPEDGIEAMEFSVEQGPKHWPTYVCVLKLYLNSNLPVAYPEEGVAGADHMLIKSTHFFMWPNPDNKRWMSLRERDRLHFGERWGRYTRSTWLATANYDWDHGAATGMFYEEYHRDIFPGLAYLKVDMGCQIFSWMSKVDTAQIWLKKEGAKDYRKHLKEDPNDFLKFSLPSTFYKKILELKKGPSQYNSVFIEELDRQRREAQAKQKIQTQN